MKEKATMITQKERDYLRELAKKQLEYANTPANKTREAAWHAHNDLTAKNPIVTLEEWTFFKEVARPLQCESPDARRLEDVLIKHLIGREDIDDDRATPDHLNVGLHTWFTPFNLQARADNKGNDLAYVYDAHINDLEEDFHKLGKSTWGVNAESTLAQIDLWQDIVGDILPVRKVFSGYASPTQWLVHLMHMETMLYSLVDYPELMHKAMDMVSADFVEYMCELDAGGHVVASNGSEAVAQGSYAYNSILQNNDISGVWGYLDSQETVGISREMFKEFFFPYYKRIGDLFGWLNYGCCEAVHEIWENCISQMANVRKVSISPWCDEEYMGEVLRKAPVLYHRKPSPNFLGMDKVFDVAGFSEHITKTIKAACGCHLEFSFRDIYSLQGEKGRANQAYKIVKDLIERHYC